MAPNRPRHFKILVTVPWRIPLLDAHADVTYGNLDTVIHPVGLLVGPTDIITDRVLDRFGPQVRAVAVAGSGTDGADLGALSRRGVALVSAPGATTEPTAELALTLMLMTARGVLPAIRSLESGTWPGWSFDQVVGRGVGGLALGLVGYGRTGRRVGSLAQALGMKVRHHCRTPTGEESFVPALEDLLGASDIVSLHVPLTAETRQLIASSEIAAMRPGSILINTSRGDVVDERALAAGLLSGHLAGAGLDVFASEPAVPSALLGLPNVVITPHIGSSTVAARTAMALEAAQKLLDAIGTSAW